MKSTQWVAFIAAVTIPLLSANAQVPPAGAANISPNAAEVVKLASSGVGDDVVLAFVQNAQAPFDLTADNVLYLRDLGVSQPVITSMLNHDSAFRSRPPEASAQSYAPAPAAAVPAPAPEAVAPQTAAAPAIYVSGPPPDVNYFYNDLAPYGTWVSLPNVGWSWQPSVVVVNHGWRPYCDAGHWVYTDGGWFWQSDYTWGWAPFHYGRWYLDAHCGWVWLPGRVWGPAWVTWRTAGTTCGWAPLPPGADFVVGAGWRYNGGAVTAGFDFGLGVNCFAFVSFGNFCAHDVAYYCVPHAEAVTIFKQTTVVNNYTVVNNTFVNHGVSVTRIAAASHTPVPRATIREGQAGVGRPVGGSSTVVYRAPLKAPERPAHMVAQKVDTTHPVIHHNTVATLGTQQRPLVDATAAGSAFQRTAAPAMKSEPRDSTSGPTTTWQHNPNTQAKGQTTAPLGTGSSGLPAHQWQAPEKPASSAQTLPASRTPQTQVWSEENRPANGSKSAATATPYSQATTSKGQSERTTTPHFYSPKTIEQSSQVRSINAEPKRTQAPPPSGTYEPGSKKNQ
jgi:hypothetical protein